MRWLLLLCSLTACGGAVHVPPKAARAPSSPEPAPPIAEARAEAVDEEAETPTPTLRVLKLSPDPTPSKTVTRSVQHEQGEVVDDAPIDAPGSRPKITLHEARREPVFAPPSSEASSTWSSESTGPRPSALDPAARAAYQRAYRVFQEQKPKEALDAFAAFVLKYPDHPYVEQATFWRGECYAKLGDSGRALEQFRGVVARFPGTPKAREAEARIASLSSNDLSNRPPQPSDSRTR